MAELAAARRRRRPPPVRHLAAVPVVTRTASPRGMERGSSPRCLGHQLARWGERVRRAVDLEHWAAFEESFAEVAHMVVDLADGNRGAPPGTITFLSGDVHHSYVAEAQHESRTPDPASGLLADPQSAATGDALRDGDLRLRSGRAAWGDGGPVSEGSRPAVLLGEPGRSMVRQQHRYLAARRVGTWRWSGTPASWPTVDRTSLRWLWWRICSSAATICPRRCCANGTPGHRVCGTTCGRLVTLRDAQPGAVHVTFVSLAPGTSSRRAKQFTARSPSADKWFTCPP